jgi:hypothetical protein
MDPVGLDLEWYRDAKGFRLDDQEAPWGEEGETVLIPEGMASFDDAMRDVRGPNEPRSGGWGRIIRVGGSLVPYRPTGSLDQILVELLNIDPALNIELTPRRVLDFVNRFGPLTRKGLDENRGEDPRVAINTSYCMNQLVDAWTFTGDNAALGQTFGADGFGLRGLETRIVFDPVEQKPRMRLVAHTLVTVLWARLFQALLSGLVIRRCAQCNKLFTAGTGTGRRLDAKFCSDEHRVLFNSLKRTPRAA